MFRIPSEPAESSTESEEEDDRVLDGKVVSMCIEWLVIASERASKLNNELTNERANEKTNERTNKRVSERTND